jgi:hypothetical protein
VTTRQTAPALLLSLLLPLAAAAQSADKPAAEPAPEPAPAAAPAEKPAPPPATLASLTFEPGGWLVLNGWADFGALNASDLPRFALRARGEQAAGGSVRQSRLRLGIGLPSDAGLLGGATFKAFVEGDFAGGYVSGDESAPIPRLRHAWVSATWKERGNLSVLVGQTTDIFHGTVAALSVSHLATPRFAGAGYIYRRAPQVRVQGELGKEVALAYQVGVLSSADKTNQTASATSVGYRAFAPDLEGRVAVLYRGALPVKAELGLGGRYGQEKFLLAGVSGSPSHFVKSRAVATDLKVDAGKAILVAGAYAGENLDVVNSITAGVVTTGTGTNGANLTSVRSIPVKGAWGQVQVSPVKPLVLLAGAGVELPRRRLLPATVTVGTSSFPAIYRNVQLSAGALVNLTARWRLGLEATRYVTYAVDRNVSRSDQVELSSLLAF